MQPIIKHNQKSRGITKRNRQFWPKVYFRACVRVWTELVLCFEMTVDKSDRCNQVTGNFVFYPTRGSSARLNTMTIVVCCINTL